MTSWSTFLVESESILESLFGVIFGFTFGGRWNHCDCSLAIAAWSQCSLALPAMNRGTLGVNVHAMHWLSRGGTAVVGHGKSRARPAAREACGRRCSP